MGLDIQQTLVNITNPIGIARRLGLCQQRRALRIRLQHMVQESLRPAGRLL